MWTSGVGGKEGAGGGGGPPCRWSYVVQYQPRVVGDVRDVDFGGGGGMVGLKGVMPEPSYHPGGEMPSKGEETMACAKVSINSPRGQSSQDWGVYTEENALGRSRCGHHWSSQQR